MTYSSPRFSHFKSCLQREPALEITPCILGPERSPIQSSRAGAREAWRAAARPGSRDAPPEPRTAQRGRLGALPGGAREPAGGQPRLRGSSRRFRRCRRVRPQRGREWEETQEGSAPAGGGRPQAPGDGRPPAPGSAPPRARSPAAGSAPRG